VFLVEISRPGFGSSCLGWRIFFKAKKRSESDRSSWGSEGAESWGFWEEVRVAARSDC
jgi:hypothetical protein